MLHLKLFSKATVRVCSLLLVVNLVVLHPHRHTSAQIDSRGQTRGTFVPGFQYSAVCLFIYLYTFLEYATLGLLAHF